jgi:peptide/nickel transport system permease protein
MATAPSGSPEQPAPAGRPAPAGHGVPPGPAATARGPARRAPGTIARFILRRALTSVVVLAAVSVVVFAATEALPGDPAQAILGRSASPQALAALRRQLHLNQPVVQQYLTWIGGVLHGQLGMSLAAQEPVTRLLGDRLVNSAFLVLAAALVSIPLSVFIGCYAAWRRDRAFDVGSSILLLILAGLPEFVVGVLAIVFLATSVLHVLPAISYLAPGQRPWGNLRGLVLPVTTLVIAVAPYVARVMRASMVEVLESDYVEMARLKGLPERTVLIRHALPNALGPTFQVIALNLAYLAGGIVVVEYVFAFPGIGSALQSAVVAHDLPVVQVLALLIAGVYVVANLAADVATILVTPRMRSQL